MGIRLRFQSTSSFSGLRTPDRFRVCAQISFRFHLMVESLNVGHMIVLILELPFKPTQSQQNQRVKRIALITLRALAASFSASETRGARLSFFLGDREPCYRA